MSGPTMDAEAWDARYAGADLVWSADANVWVRELCGPMRPGLALDVAAGEGRNAFWLVEQGWSVVATDFSSVGVRRMLTIADDRLAERRSAFHAFVGDATRPAPPPSNLAAAPSGATRSAGGPYDLVLISYLHLPREQWDAALAAAVAACAVGGAVLVVAHAARNLAEGVGGPQDPTILLDPPDVIASANRLPVDADVLVEVELAELRRRGVEGADRPALDTVVLLRVRAVA